MRASTGAERRFLKHDMRVACCSEWIQCDTIDAGVVQFQERLSSALPASAAFGITIIVDTRF
jgi:hypothetical protein